MCSPLQNYDEKSNNQRLMRSAPAHKKHLRQQIAQNKVTKLKLLSQSKFKTIPTSTQAKVKLSFGKLESVHSNLGTCASSRAWSQQIVRPKLETLAEQITRRQNNSISSLHSPTEESRSSVKGDWILKDTLQRKKKKNLQPAQAA